MQSKEQTKEYLWIWWTHSHQWDFWRKYKTPVYMTEDEAKNHHYDLFKVEATERTREFKLELKENKMKEIFKDAKVGDKVWDLKYGNGTIISTKHTSETPIYVKFDSSHDKHFTIEGMLLGNPWERNNVQTLFWQEFQIPKEAYQKPLPKLEVDTKVLVSSISAPDIWHKRYFSHFGNNGEIYCFDNGQTSWSFEGGRCMWSNWKLVDEN